MAAPDHSLDRLLDLDGVVLVISEDSQYWVKFEVWQIPPTAGKPHGLGYSLTLHGPGNERLVGLTTPTRCHLRSGASLKIIFMLARKPNRTNILMLQLYLKPSGRKSRQCWTKKV